MRERFGDGTLNPLQQFSRAIKQSPEWLFLSGGCSMLKHNKTFQMASENIWDWWNVDFYCHIILDRCLNWNSESLLCEKSSKDFLFMPTGPHLTARSIYMSTFLEISVVIIFKQWWPEKRIELFPKPDWDRTTYTTSILWLEFCTI